MHKLEGYYLLALVNSEITEGIITKGSIIYTISYTQSFPESHSQRTNQEADVLNYSVRNHACAKQKCVSRYSAHSLLESGLFMHLFIYWSIASFHHSVLAFFLPSFIQWTFIEPITHLLLRDREPVPALRGAWDIANAVFWWSHLSCHQPSHWMPTKSAAARTQLMTQVPCPPTMGHLSPPCWKPCENMGVGARVWCLSSSPPKVKNKQHPWESKLMFSGRKKKTKTGETFSYYDNQFCHISKKSMRGGKSVSGPACECEVIFKG